MKDQEHTATDPNANESTGPSANQSNVKVTNPAGGSEQEEVRSYRLEIAADRPQDVREAFDQIMQEDAVKQALSRENLSVADFNLQINRTAPAEAALIIALIQFGSLVATEVFKQIILPRLKEKYGVRVDEQAGSKAGEQSQK